MIYSITVVVFLTWLILLAVFFSAAVYDKMGFSKSQLSAAILPTMAAEAIIFFKLCSLVGNCEHSWLLLGVFFFAIMIFFPAAAGFLFKRCGWVEPEES